jgi:crotonobetainyl-CoA:carnitine CoA-transferase CaiB-like acyl-CoA transferase
VSTVKKAGIPSGAALSFDEAMADPHILARQMIVETDHARQEYSGRSASPQSSRARRANCVGAFSRRGEHNRNFFWDNVTRHGERRAHGKR